MAQAMLTGHSPKEKQSPLLTGEVLELLNTEFTVSSIPFRLNGGQIFVFKPPSSIEKDDWKADGHRWCNRSSKKLPRKDPLFRKTYFYAKGENLKPMHEFRRDVYFPIENPQNIAVIHYIGNSGLSIPGPHGNSLKQTKLFFRTKPSVVKKIIEEVEGKAPHKVYKQMIAGENAVNEATDKPRNVKQVQNIKAASVSAKRLSGRDAIMYTHEIAYEENGFTCIWHITTYPDVAVVIGHQEILDLLTEAISWNRPGILLSYDTTLNLFRRILCLPFAVPLFRLRGETCHSSNVPFS